MLDLIPLRFGSRISGALDRAPGSTNFIESNFLVDVQFSEAPNTNIANVVIIVLFWTNSTLIVSHRFGFARGLQEPAGAGDAVALAAGLDGAAQDPGGTVAPPAHLHLPRRLLHPPTRYVSLRQPTQRSVCITSGLNVDERSVRTITVALETRG